MKLRSKLLMLAIFPTLLLGICSIFVASSQIKNGILDEAYDGMQATTLAIREVFDSSVEGEYHLDTDGEMWKGDDMNVSAAYSVVDSVKNDTGFDVTVFYGDTRMLTTFVDENGDRMIGTQASDTVTKAVLENGEDYENNNTEIFGNRYIVYYIPLYQSGTTTPVGMIFLGRPYADVATAINASIARMVIVTILVLLIAAVAAFIIGSKIASSLKTSIAYVEEMSTGKLGIRMSDKLLQRRDEIGTMCRSVRSLDQHFRDVVHEIQTQSNILGNTTTTCNNNAKRALDSTEQIDASVQEIASSTTSQAQDAQDAENSVSTIGEIIENTNNQMQEFSDASKRMDEASNVARKTLFELNKNMQQVKSSIDQIRHQTNETHISVEKISEMANVITEIASQTSLLSLNASIEAARAGEFGRGFAVVASEIQQLSDQSNKSAMEIQDILVQLKNNSDSSMNTMNEVQHIINGQEEKLNHTNTAFDTVEAGIQKSLSSVREILTEMTTLNDAKTSTASIVQNVAAIAEQNAASTEETAASVDEVAQTISDISREIENLQSVANILQEKVSVFQVEHQTVPSV